MTIEACNAYSDDEIYTRQVEFPVQSTWNRHQMTHLAEGNISHLVKGYPMAGWSKMKNQIKPMDVGGNGSLTFKAEWGDKEGPKFTIEGSVGVHDDKGNYADISGSQDSNGQGKAEIEIGHEEDVNSK
jgi:hypothetical protein